MAGYTALASQVLRPAAFAAADPLDESRVWKPVCRRRALPTTFKRSV
jgi:hypothetical protein